MHNCIVVVIKRTDGKEFSIKQSNTVMDEVIPLIENAYVSGIYKLAVDHFKIKDLKKEQ